MLITGKKTDVNSRKIHRYWNERNPGWRHLLSYCQYLLNACDSSASGSIFCLYIDKDGAVREVPIVWSVDHFLSPNWTPTPPPPQSHYVGYWKHERQSNINPFKCLFIRLETRSSALQGAATEEMLHQMWWCWDRGSPNMGFFHRVSGCSEDMWLVIICPLFTDDIMI